MEAMCDGKAMLSEVKWEENHNSNGISDTTIHFNNELTRHPKTLGQALTLLGGGGARGGE